METDIDIESYFSRLLRYSDWSCFLIKQTEQRKTYIETTNFSKDFKCSAYVILHILQFLSGHHPF